MSTTLGSRVLLAAGLLLALIAVVLWLDGMRLAGLAADLQGGGLQAGLDRTVGGTNASSALRVLLASLSGGLSVAIFVVLWVSKGKSRGAR